MSFPISGSITLNCSGAMVRESYLTTAIYAVTLKDTGSDKTSVLQVAAISAESAANRTLEIAPTRFKYFNPEIINVVKVY